MRLRQIEVFYAIYRCGSVTQAAELLHVSQPSVSKVLAHTEKQLGFRLFERVKGKLIPTTEANLLFPETEKIYQQLENVKSQVSHIQHHQGGLLDIAVTPALGFSIIPQAVAQFKAQHPDTQVRIQTLHNQQAQQALLAHKCDVALLFDSPKLAGVKEVTLGENEVVVLYPKNMFDKPLKSFPITALQRRELIGIWESGPIGEKVLKLLRENNIQPNSHLQVDTYFIAARMVGEGLGCCTIDRLTAQANLAENMAIAPFESPISFQIKALHLDSKPLSKMNKLFLNTVQQQLHKAR